MLHQSPWSCFLTSLMPSALMKLSMENSREYAFLQMLDACSGNGVLVAATNHDRILDFAVWRRFDEVFVFELPDRSQLRSLPVIKLRGLRRDFDIENARVIGCLEGMSHADVERVIRRAIKSMVLKGQHLLTQQHLLSAIKRENARKERLRKCWYDMEKNFPRLPLQRELPLTRRDR